MIPLTTEEESDLRALTAWPVAELVNSEKVRACAHNIALVRGLAVDPHVLDARIDGLRPVLDDGPPYSPRLAGEAARLILFYAW